MINKIEFTAKNLTSNSGVLPLLNYTEEQRIFQELDENLVFDNKTTEEIKMNHLKTLICGGFIGVDKLSRFLLLKTDPLIKECGINVREPENISRFLYNFSFKTTQMLRDINIKIFKKLLKKKKLRKIGGHSRFVEDNIKSLQNNEKIYSSFFGQIFYLKVQKSSVIKVLTSVEHMFGIYFSPILEYSRKIVIDIDSRAVNVEGNQEGAVKGYNPGHKGNNCYNILMAFCDELKAFVTGFMRSGNTYTSNGAAEMIKEIIANLRDEVDNIVFRMDSGYFSEEIVEVIEGAGYEYVIKAKGYSNMLDKAYDIPVENWEDYGYQKQAMFVSIKPDKWNKSRKFAVVRELKPEEDRKQLSFLESSNYNHAMYVTNTTWELADTVKFYEKRGNCENYIKETKYDMNIGSLKMKSFWANEAFFQIMMLVYNIFLLFKMDKVPVSEYRQWIQKFRLKYVFVAGKIIMTARQTILKILEGYPYKEIFQ